VYPVRRHLSSLSGPQRDALGAALGLTSGEDWGALMRRPELWLACAAFRSVVWSIRATSRASGSRATSRCTSCPAVHLDLHSMLTPQLPVSGSSSATSSDCRLVRSVSSSLRLRCDSEGP
jgi:hypothetical protein